MKQVFSSASDCIHKFSQRTQDRGRCSNVFFEYERIYSYGYHYELARFIDAENILINNRGYSKTTSNHVYTVIHATRQYKQWFTMNSDPKLVENQLSGYKKSLEKAKKPEKYLEPALALIRNYKAYCEKFGYHQVSQNLSDLFEYFSSDFSDINEQIKKSIEAKKLKQLALLEQYKNAFNNFEPFESLRNELKLNYDLLRINGDFIETSQHVKVPYHMALDLFKRYTGGEDIAGEDIAGYRVIKSTPDIVKIGCHNLRISELETIFNK